MSKEVEEIHGMSEGIKEDTKISNRVFTVFFVLAGLGLFFLR